MNVDPESCGLPENLARELSEWAADFDRTYGAESPLESGFSDSDSEALFYDAGFRLALRVSQALGPGVEVVYFDGRSGSVHRVSL